MTAMLPWWWRWAALGLLMAAAAAVGAWKMHQWDQAKYELLQGQFEDFKVRTEALGRVAEARKLKAEAQQKRKLTVVEADHEKALVDLHVRARSAEQQLRDALSARGSIVPDRPGTSGESQATASYDRERLAGGLGAGLGRFAQRYQEIIRRGGEAALGLRACIAGWQAVADAINQASGP